jgi:hypothetical protein
MQFVVIFNFESFSNIIKIELIEGHYSQYRIAAETIGADIVNQLTDFCKSHQPRVPKPTCLYLSFLSSRKKIPTLRYWSSCSCFYSNKNRRILHFFNSRKEI